MNSGSHVILCGQISQYNKDVPYPPPLSEETKETLRRKNITRERFTVLNYMNQAEAALCELSQRVQSGQINVRRKRMTACGGLCGSVLVHHLVIIMLSLCRCWKLW